MRAIDYQDRLERARREAERAWAIADQVQPDMSGRARGALVNRVRNAYRNVESLTAPIIRGADEELSTAARHEMLRAYAAFKHARRFST